MILHRLGGSYKQHSINQSMYLMSWGPLGPNRQEFRLDTSTSFGAGHVCETQYLLLSGDCSRDSRTERRNRNGSTEPTSLQAGLSKGHEQSTTHNLQPKHALAQRIDTLCISRCKCACSNFYVVSTADANSAAACMTDKQCHTSIHATMRIVQAAGVLWPQLLDDRGQLFHT